MSNKKLIHGFHAVNARLWQNPKSVLEIFLAGGRQDARAQAVLDKAASESVKAHIVDKARLDSLTGNARHQGVVAMIDANQNFVTLDDVLENLAEPPLLLILDGVTDPHNLGACLRVADAMGAHAVIAPKDRSATLNATVSKVACGAAEVVPYITVTNLARTLRDLKDAGVWIAGTTMEADTDLYHFDASGPLAWVMGAEGEGMRRLTREHCDVLVSIPMFGTVESLNVSVSSGMVLSESRRQRVLKQG
ncbi:23S rRNA (guanosine(2251)-2'-O)-methyltransferase RlmB [Vogesella urethralis]|jgi:23S rRNA (guanosine2251-2'-O)-methyltransferase|uniref:23S rRNA (guanosine(2251)-2'-O)-methyltransferase RlmB n=1 Tax=Vogesella urethralis TaxID=2592656 RepID=UPI001184791F|nr:23S rRNA (guanosine(2251)-2'-O)-methyltransferase RlmB [Vogesella urethralis]MEC5208366.1 23S rRNA (guanosine2251-2'-O)-methyltransferase [Vogesella perlucida]